ncbi:hypothetical protein KZ829_01710 [Actinoplanes hulinensis]|uniref:Uncharacterized protein n=1 Tax=Actinoplanes hulinensis TaxID=1144547 RepID=A0ABS7AWJ4_9ACTN|nr:hypothetical protein [Actinoplanes hulinensis]MBW6432458.1 hypothetical protein [Actinoplanes hulinensis]
MTAVLDRSRVSAVVGLLVLFELTSDNVKTLGGAVAAVLAALVQAGGDTPTESAYVTVWLAAPAALFARRTETVWRIFRYG